MPTPTQIRIRKENLHLRELIQNMKETKDALAYFAGPDEAHEVSEERFLIIEECIFDLELIYNARRKAANRKVV
jgi:hypothetical protein